MPLELNALNSRLARRIFSTFIACALIPVVILAALSLFQVDRELESQAWERLHRAAKNHGLSIYEHLLFCEDELDAVDFRDHRNIARQHEKFSAIGRRYPDGRYEALWGAPIPAVSLTPQQKAYLENGNTLLVVGGGPPAKILLIRDFDAGTGSPGLLVGRVHAGYLWGLNRGNSLPPVCEFAIVSPTHRPIYHSFEGPLSSGDIGRFSAKRYLRMRMAGTDWFAATWSLFLKPRFGCDIWNVVVMQPAAYVLAPLSRFKHVFILVVILALLLVAVLSLFNLRRSLRPIEALKTGVRKIAQRDFSHRVHISSRDEFQELAQGFNDMSGRLGTQFELLFTQAKINRATLMASDFDQIAKLSVTRLLQGFALERVSIGRVDAVDTDEALIYLGYASAPDSVDAYPLHGQGNIPDRFRRKLPWVTTAAPAALSGCLPPALLDGGEPVTVFPVFVKDRLHALLTVTGPAGRPPSRETLGLIRQIADHLAVAWSNVNLIRDLRALTIGSMQALARAVDAKSPWTAGHSARVMRIALAIGRHLGLPPERIDRLQQAALLHDIGKIGVSSAILDKPGKLTDEEFAAIRRHPAIGDNILAPIPAFKAIIPMVRQHHERWDGRGYPDGVSGEEIIREARILAVADVFDAMTSDRPYRKSMPLGQAMSIIHGEAGRQFDPAIVAAFVELMAEKDTLAA